MNTNPMTITLGACITTILIFIVYSSQYNKKILRSRIYKILFYILFYLEISEWVYYFVAYYLPNNDLLINVAIKAHWAIGFIIFIACLYYIKSLIRPELTKIKDVIIDKQSKFMAAFAIIAFIIFLFLPCQPFNDNNEILFVQGLPSYLVFLFAILVLIRIAIISAKAENVDKKKLKTFNIYFFIISMVTVGMQLLLPTIALIPLGMTFLIYSLYYLAENPDIYIIDDLTKIKDKLASQANIKTELLYNLSDDFSKPVNNIIKYSKKITEDEDGLKNLKENLDEITDNGRNLIEIIDELMESTTENSDSIKLDSVAYSIADVFREIKTKYEYKLKNPSISYEVSIHPNTPNKFYGDIGKVKKAIESVVATALNQTEIGKVVVKVNCSTSGNKGDINISVIDTGKGIRKENLKGILEITKNNTSGHGLPVANKYLSMLGGTMKIDSTYLAGTEVYLTIPQTIRDYSPIKLDENVIAKNNKLVIKNYNKQKILIVDEDSLNRKVIKNVLEPYNFEIDEVSSGIDCLNKIKSEIKYSLILIDHQMEGLNGPEVLTALIKLKNYFEVPPVIMVTANVAVGVREEYLNEGFDDYVGKPVSASELNRIINSYVKIKNKNGYEINEMKFNDEDTPSVSSDNIEYTTDFESPLNELNPELETNQETIEVNEESTEEIHEKSIEEIPQSVELSEITFEDVEHVSNNSSNLMDPNQK